MVHSDAEITMYLITSLRRFAARKATQYRRWKQRELLLFDAPAGGPETEDVRTWGDLVSTEEETEKDVIINNLVKQILHSLPAREKEIIEETFLLERTETQIAQKLGIRQQRVNQLKKQALLRMRGECVKMGITA